jgi:hypothetical protein
MHNDKRKYPRRPVVLNVELSYPSGEIKTVKSRDISEGGLFLVMEGDSPVLGEVVGIRLTGDSVGEETLPSAEAVVVHKNADGIGVAFIEMEFDDDF